MAKTAYTRKPRKVYKKKAMTKSTKTPSLAIKKYVNRAIHKNIENKIALFQTGNQTVTSYARNTAMLTFSAIPWNSLGLNVSQNGRIGNQIKIRKVTLSFVLRPYQYDITNNDTVKPQHVYIFIGKVKNAKTQVPIASDFARLYQLGPSSQGPQGSLIDTVANINKDWFTIYKRLTFKVGFSQASATGIQGPSGSPVYQYYGNNDYKLTVIKKLDLTKYCPKTLQFNDTTDQPTNDGLFVFCYCNPMDNGLTTPIPIKMDYNTEMEYEDA